MLAAHARGEPPRRDNVRRAIEPQYARCLQQILQAADLQLRYVFGMSLELLPNKRDLLSYIPATIDGFRVTVTTYADDTQIVPTGPRNRLAEMQSSMSSVLDGILTWLLQHDLKVNMKKTELLLIGGPRVLPKSEDVTPISVQFNGETIHESQSGYVRNIRVTMDTNLNWVKHIDKTVAKCCGILIGLASAKNVLPLNVLPRLIDALVFHICDTACKCTATRQTVICEKSKKCLISRHVSSRVGVNSIVSQMSRAPSAGCRLVNSWILMIAKATRLDRLSDPEKPSGH